MKLPDIQYSNVSLPVGASPQIAVAKAQGIAQMSSAITSVLGDFAAANTKREVSNAAIARIDSMTDFSMEHAGKEFYTSQELTDLNISDAVATKGRTEIPASEVHPFLLERQLTKSINEAADGIGNKKKRQEWKAQAELRGAQQLQRVVERSRVATRKQTTATAINAVVKAQASGLYEEASELIDELPLTTADKQVMRGENKQKRTMHSDKRLAYTDDYQAMGSQIELLEDDIANGTDKAGLSPDNATDSLRELRAGYKRARSNAATQEGEQYFQSMRTQNPEAITDSIDNLRADNYSGMLEEKERGTWINRLEVERKSLTTNRDNRVKAQRSMQFDDFNKMTEALTGGGALHPTAINQATEMAANLAQQPDLTVAQEKDLIKFFDARENYAELAVFQAAPLPDQQKMLTTGNTPATIEKSDQRLRAYTANRKALETDSISYYQRSGNQVDQLPEPTDPQFANAIGDRLRLDRQIFETNGISAGPLSAPEADVLGDWLLTNNPASLRIDSPIFWEQLSKTNAGPRAVAGGAPLQVGQQIIAGEGFRGDYEAKDLKAMHRDAMYDMGSAYGLDHTLRRSHATAIVNHHLVALQRDESADIVDSIEAVTGGLVEFNGVTFQTPEPGTTSDQVEAWVDQLEPADLPFIQQGTSDDLLLQLQSGGINLVPAGVGKFYMQRLDTGMFISNEGQRSTLTWPKNQNFDGDAFNRSAAIARGRIQ